MFFSIIVPIYNSAPYLDQCFDSILQQSYKDFEILCIDDGSDDNSLDICHLYAQRDKRIRVINQMHSGVSAARNRGIDHASGDWIWFVDSDDYIKQGSLERFNHIIMNHDDLDSLCFSYSVLTLGEELFVSIGSGHYKNKQEQSALGFAFNGFYDSSVKRNNGVQLWNKLYRSQLVKDNKLRFNESIRYAEDMLFNTEYTFLCQKTLIIDEPYYVYRHNIASLMNSDYSPSPLSIEKNFYILKCVEDIFRMHNINESDYLPYLVYRYIRIPIEHTERIVKSKNSFFCKLQNIYQNTECWNQYISENKYDIIPTNSFKMKFELFILRKNIALIQFFYAEILVFRHSRKKTALNKKLNKNK